MVQYVQCTGSTVRYVRPCLVRGVLCLAGGSCEPASKYGCTRTAVIEYHLVVHAHVATAVAMYLLHEYILCTALQPRVPVVADQPVAADRVCVECMDGYGTEVQKR